MELHPETRRRLGKIIVQLKSEEETYGLHDRLDLQKEDEQDNQLEVLSEFDDNRTKA